jgi:arsenate reductase-like glutaredoxin family protein
VLDRTNAKVSEERSSKSAPMKDAEVKALLASVEEVVVAKGKKAVAAAAKSVALDDLRGPTGNFRAPMVRVGKRLLVGFHPETLEAFLRG